MSFERKKKDGQKPNQNNSQNRQYYTYKKFKNKKNINKK